MLLVVSHIYMCMNFLFRSQSELSLQGDFSLRFIQVFPLAFWLVAVKLLTRQISLSARCRQITADYFPLRVNIRLITSRFPQIVTIAVIQTKEISERVDDVRNIIWAIWMIYLCFKLINFWFCCRTIVFGGRMFYFYSPDKPIKIWIHQIWKGVVNWFFTKAFVKLLV